MVLWPAQGTSVAQITRLALPARTGSGTCCITSTPTGWSRCTPATLVDARRCSRWRSGRRSRGLPSPPQPITGCRSPGEPGQDRGLPGRPGSRTSPHAGLRELPRGERLVSGREDLEASADPDHSAKKARVDHLHTIAGGEVAAGPSQPPLRRIRAPCHHTGGVRHLLAARELGVDKMNGHIKNASGAADSCISAATCAACTGRLCGSPAGPVPDI